jgi:hypothetical protein
MASGYHGNNFAGMRRKAPEKEKLHNWSNVGYVKGDRRSGGGGSNGGGGKRTRFQGHLEKGDQRRS